MKEIFTVENVAQSTFSTDYSFKETFMNKTCNSMNVVSLKTKHFISFNINKYKLLWTLIKNEMYNIFLEYEWTSICESFQHLKQVEN